MKLFVAVITDEAADRFVFQSSLDESVVEFWLLDSDDLEE